MMGMAAPSTDVTTLYRRYGQVLKRPAVQMAVIAIATFLVYSNSITAPFVYDDIIFIVDNAEIKELANFLSLAGTRWFGLLTFALNYRFGGLNTLGYHIVNLAIHLGNAILIYWLVILTSRTPYFTGVGAMSRGTGNQEQGRIASGSRATPSDSTLFVALFSALFFACHPLQTQAVTYIWQRVASLATLLFLMSLVMYVQWRLLSAAPDGQGDESDDRNTANRSARSRVLWYAAALVFAFLAMKTKEISSTLPAVLFLYEVSFFGLAGFSERKHAVKRILYLLPFLAMIAIIPLSMLGTTQGSHEPELGSREGQRQLQLYNLQSYAAHDYLVTQVRVIVTYLRLLILPVNQNFDYDYPIYRSFLQPEIVLSLALLLSIIGSAAFLFYVSSGRPRDPRSAHGGAGMTGARSFDPPVKNQLRLISFGILWFFITLSVESSIIPISYVIFEHRVYLPSVGYFLAFASGIELIRTRWVRARVAITCLVVVLIGAYSVAAYARNTVWGNSIRLYEDGMKKSPNKADTHSVLGLAYANNGDVDNAIKEYSTALTIRPDDVDARINLGVAYADSGDLDKAIREYLVALEMSPNNAVARVNLGRAYAMQGAFDRAMAEFLAAVRINPQYAPAHINLGVIYANQGRIDEAINEFVLAVKMNPGSAEAYYNLGKAYSDKGFLDLAINEYRSALKNNPDYADAHYNLGDVYAQLGLIDESMHEFREVIRINPGDADARNYLRSLLNRDQ